MPTYAYVCDECGHRIERLHKPAERLRETCTQCGHAPMTWQFPTPNLHTETTWLANRDDGFGEDERSRKIAYAKARKAGVNPTGKVYCPSLCPLGESFSPEAWVDSKHQARQKCKQNNWYSEDLGVTPAPLDNDPKPYQVADDVVQNEVVRVVEARKGDLSARERKTIVDDTRERLSGNMGKKKV